MVPGIARQASRQRTRNGVLHLLLKLEVVFQLPQVEPPLIRAQVLHEKVQRVHSLGWLPSPSDVMASVCSAVGFQH